MHVFKLTDTFYPTTSVTDFKSLVWVERYREAGEFTIQAEDDISLIETLPIDCLISHTDTYDVMRVENHEIVRDKNKKLQVTISGRSFEVIGEDRTTPYSELPFWNDTQTIETPVMVYGMNAAGVAHEIMRSRLMAAPLGYPPAFQFIHYAPTSQIVPHLEVWTDLNRPKAAGNFPMKRGEAYEAVLGYLAIDDAGIKVIRPHNLQTVMFIITYDGEDLTDNVIFYAAREDLDDTKYFQSIKGHKNYATVAALRYAREVRHSSLSTDLVGIKKRLIYVEAQDLKLHPTNYEPPAVGDEVWSRAQLEMDEHPKLFLMQATVSTSAKPKFKIDYNLGDLVSVFGEFGVTQIMRVTEHILTIDDKGQQGYPTLSIATL